MTLLWALFRLAGVTTNQTEPKLIIYLADWLSGKIGGFSLADTFCLAKNAFYLIQSAIKNVFNDLKYH